MTSRLGRRIALVVLLAAGFLGGGVSSLWLRRSPRFRRAWQGWFGPKSTGPVAQPFRQPVARPALLSLPYLAFVPDSHPELRGVVRNDAARAWPGWNFYSTHGRPNAYVVDMQGNRLWQWSLRSDPEFGRIRWLANKCHWGRPAPDGSVIVSISENGILKLDRDSRRLWFFRALTTHDTARDPEENVYGLIHEWTRDPAIEADGPVLEDSLVILGPDGRLQRQVSLVDALRRSGFGYLLPNSRPGVGRAEREPPVAMDVLHSNHVEWIDGRLASRSPIYRRGNLLVSFRNINSVAILDGESFRVLWLWGPNNLALQHDPVLLANGHVLVFNNGLAASEVLEVDPLTGTVAWRYAPELGFFSNIRGGCQRLPNGDTLITDSQSGIAFEVTEEGETVWRYANPEFVRPGFRSTMFRMLRFSPSTLPFIRDANAGS